MSNNFLEMLNIVGNELLKHHSTKNELTLDLIQERLTGSLKSYYAELNSTVNRLSNIDAVKLDRSINETSGFARRFE